MTGTPTDTIAYWQGATFTGLTEGTYTFTYQPITNPSSTWRPTDNVILSSSVALTSADLGGGLFSPNSNNRSSGAAAVLDSLVGSAQTVNGALDTVQVRMDAVRTSGFTPSLMDDYLSGKLMVASNDSGAGLVSDDRPLTHGVWGKVFGSEARQGANGGFAGYKANTYGLSLGTDTLVNNHWVLGAAFTFADTVVGLWRF